MRRAYVHLPRFPVQRRVMQTPALAQKALALVENQRGHMRVAFASSAALRAGVRLGMTQTAACALVPELPCFPHDPDEERRALVSLGEALLQCGPQFELRAPDGLFVDAAASHLFAGEAGLCRRLIEVCQTHGYRARVAVADDAFTARALARHGEKRAACVPTGESAAHLGPLPLLALEEHGGVVAPLRSLGLSSLGEVAALPLGAVVARLGADGLWAHRLCRGEDDTPLVAEALAEVLEEKVDLDWPAEAMEPLLFGLKTLLDRLCQRLAGRAQAAVRLEFVLRLDPGGEASVPLRLARPTAQAKLLLDLARHRIADLTVPNPVVGLRVKVTEACEDRGQQLPLGDQPAGDAALEVVLSRLATTLGEESLFCAEVADAHRPEAAYQPRAFSPPERDHGVLAEAKQLSAGLAVPAQGERPSKRKPNVRRQAQLPGLTDENAWLFGTDDPAPPAIPAAGTADPRLALPSVPAERAQTLNARPARLFTRPTSLEAEVGQGGELKAARLLGRRRRVEAVAGPERLAGDWWETEYVRDYYRVYFEGLGPVWIFRDDQDGRFYLHGMFD